MPNITSTITNNFARSFGLYQDFVTLLDEAMLDAKLPDLPSNTIGLQLWCVVGARESYSNAIKANQWSGFSCSLAQPHNKEDVLAALIRSENLVKETLKAIENYTDTQNQLSIDLLEHECQHHGQLIRYLYALKLEIPESWKKRYALN